MRGRFLETYGVLIAFGLLLLVNVVWQPHFFLQPENLRNLISQNASVGILAVGMTLVIVGGGIDLSVGSMMALVASLMVLTVNKLVPGRGESFAVTVGVGVCVGMGLILGLLNGLIITVGRCVPFIVTLAGLVAYRSICLALAEGGEIRSASSTVLPALGEGGIHVPGVRVPGGDLLVLTWPMIAFVLIAVAASFLLNRTLYGRYLLAVGANARAARYSAVPVARVKALSYVIMGFCVAIAALGETGRLNTVPTAQMGLYYELDAIAAVVIGGASMSGGRGRVWATVVGVLILGIITNMLALKGVSVYWQGCVKGIIILIAVLLQRSAREEA